MEHIFKIGTEKRISPNQRFILLVWFYFILFSFFYFLLLVIRINSRELKLYPDLGHRPHRDTMDSVTFASPVGAEPL